MTAKRLGIGLSGVAVVTAMSLIGAPAMGEVESTPTPDDGQIQDQLSDVAESAAEQEEAAEAVADQLAQDKVAASKVEEKDNTPIRKIAPRLDIPRGKIGVAQTATLRFGVPVTRKKAVVKHIRVTSNKKLSPGRWAWFDNQTAVYRTKKFLPGKAKIRFHVELKGIKISRAGGISTIGGPKANYTKVMKTSRSMIIKISDRKHTLRVIQNGKLKKTFGVSLGKGPRTWTKTRSGVKVLTRTKYRMLRMVGRDPGTGDTWDVNSPYSLPLTTTGEFIHGAPWARYRIGRYNGSHGCTNMNPEDARWLYHRVLPGDPVITKGTGRRMTPGVAIGQGKYWAYSWSKWKKMAA